MASLTGDQSRNLRVSPNLLLQILMLQICGEIRTLRVSRQYASQECVPQIISP